MTGDAANWSDEQLVGDIRRQSGNQDLWTLLFKRYQKLLYSMSYRSCNGNLSDTEDLLQEIQLALVKAIPQYEGRGGASVSTFIWRVAKNVCGQHLTRRRRERERMVDDEGQEVIEKTVSPQPTPETEAFIEEAARQIKEHLNPDEWQIINLFHLKKQAHTEIARRLGLPSEGASRKRLCLAVSALRAVCETYNITAEELRFAMKRLCYDDVS